MSISDIVNNEQLKTIGRWAVTFGGGFLVGKGYITADQLKSVSADLQTIVPALISLGALTWGIVTHTNKNTVVAASNVPGVKAVVVDTGVATDASPGVIAAAASTTAPKVVGG